MSDWLGAMVCAEEYSASYSGSRKCYLVRAGQPGHRVWPVITIHAQIYSHWTRGVGGYNSSYAI